MELEIASLPLAARNDMAGQVVTDEHEFFPYLYEKCRLSLLI